MNILIIDDDFLVAGALKTILETQEDFHVPACGSDGSEAAALFRQHRPDVLLMEMCIRDRSRTSPQSVKFIVTVYRFARGQ